MTSGLQAEFGLDLGAEPKSQAKKLRLIFNGVHYGCYFGIKWRVEEDSPKPTRKPMHALGWDIKSTEQHQFYGGHGVIEEQVGPLIFLFRLGRGSGSAKQHL